MAGVAAMARVAAKQVAQSSQVPKRSIHSGSPRMCYYDYEHREHMYEIWNMKHRGLKFGLLVWGGMVAGGIAFPVYIVRHHLKKFQG